MSYRTILATNTKSRRLAYLQALVIILKSGKFTKSQLLEKMAKWSEENTQNLRDYWVETGQITSTHQKSAGSRYIELATSLGLIASISGVYRYTRIGLVLLTLIDTTDSANNNPFFLSPESKLFFAYVLLDKDADFILLIADYLLSSSNPSLTQMQREFKQLFTERLNAKISVVQDERLRRILLDRRLEVEAWKKPERYSEHLLPPRLNWLLDLGLLEPGEFAKHRYVFTDSGRQFFNSIPLQGNIHEINEQWLQSSFWASISLLAESPMVVWNKLDEQKRSDLAAHFLKIAFKCFRLTNVPRVSLTQTLLFVCISFTLRGILVDPLTFANWLSSNQTLNNIRYEIRRSPRENEAYIVARPT